MPDYSTITVRSKIKDRLALVKGSKSWDAFLGKIAEDYPTEEVIQELERRLTEIKSGKVQGVPWEEVRADMARRRKARRGPVAARRKR